MSNQGISPSKIKRKSTHYNIRSKPLTVQIYTDESAFSKLENEWTKLARLSNQMVCMSSGWAASWWKHFGRHKNRSLCIITVYDKQKLVAIFPFFKGITKVGNITLQKRIQIIGSCGNTNEQLGFTDDYGISDFLDLIVDPEYSTPVANLFIKLLESPEFAGQQITFHQVRDDSYIMNHIYPLLKKSERKVQAEQTDTCYYIDIDRTKDFKDFVKKSKSNARRRFRQTMRARGIGNEFIIEEPTSMDDVEQMIDKLMQVHQEKWNHLGYPGAFQDKRFQKFFKEISYAAYRDNRLWIKQAVDEGGVCAVRMLLMFNGRYYDYMSGYDENSPSAKYRPGIGLLLDLVENSFEEPINRIELLRGDEGYKQDFTQLVLNNWKITIPENRNRKTGWGLPAVIIQFCSTIFKYWKREKMLLNIQYKKAGFLNMFPGYFKFRIDIVLHKISEMKKKG